MPVIRNGVARAAIVAGESRQAEIVNGVNRLADGGGQTAVDFTINNAGITFSVTRAGRVTLTIAMGGLENTNFSNNQEIGINNGTITLTGSIRVPTDTAAWTNSGELITISGITATQQATSADVRNTYSDWTNDGDPDSGEPTIVEGDFSEWETIPTTIDQEFLNERRCRTITTTTPRTQNQSRTCTASGGCDGPFTRTIDLSPSVSTTEECETRTSTTANPDFLPEFTFSDITLIGVVTIDPETGVVQIRSPFDAGLTDAEGNALQFTASLVSQSSYPVLDAGADAEARDVGLRIQGETPGGFRNAGTFFDLRGTVRAFQTAPPAPTGATGATLPSGSTWTDRSNFTVTPNITPAGAEWSHGVRVNLLNADRGVIIARRQGNSIVFSLDNSAPNDIMGTITITIFSGTTTTALTTGTVDVAIGGIV